MAKAIFSAVVFVLGLGTALVFDRAYGYPWGLAGVLVIGLASLAGGLYALRLSK